MTHILICFGCLPASWGSTLCHRAVFHAYSVPISIACGGGACDPNIFIFPRFTHPGRRHRRCLCCDPRRGPDLAQRSARSHVGGACSALCGVASVGVPTTNTCSHSNPPVPLADGRSSSSCSATTPTSSACTTPTLATTRAPRPRPQARRGPTQPPPTYGNFDVILDRFRAFSAPSTHASIRVTWSPCCLC